jgi:nitrile hydratase
MQAPRGYHDIGGLAEGPIDIRTRDLFFWEKQIAAMRVLLGDPARGLVPLDELRLTFETFGEKLYRTLGFFERMLESTVRILEKRGLATRVDLELRADRIAEGYGGRRRLLPGADDGDAGGRPDPYGGSYRYWAVAGPDAPPNRFELLCHALRDALVERGVFTADEVRRAIERIEAPGTHLGARIVARAWRDAAFRARILADGMDACREYAIPFFDGRLTIVANTPEVHNVAVCTLCSCYPRNLLGQPPAWYVSKAYRARTVREPRAVLAEFGTLLPDHVDIRVHDSTAELRYMILPLQPEGTEDWSEDALAAIVTRDSLIGTGLVTARREP